MSADEMRYSLMTARISCTRSHLGQAPVEVGRRPRPGTPAGEGAEGGETNVVINVSQRLGAGDVDPSLVLLPEHDVRRLPVDADAEALEFGLDHPFVRQGLVDVQHDEDEMAGLGHGDDLPATTFAVLGALDDTG